MNLEEEIRLHFVKKYLKGTEPDGFDNEYDLIENELLDSLTIMNLVTHLEKTYAIEFGVDDIVHDHFRSIKTLADFVKGKLVN
jgi:acyl carrier protein